MEVVGAQAHLSAQGPESGQLSSHGVALTSPILLAPCAQLNRQPKNALRSYLALLDSNPQH